MKQLYQSILAQIMVMVLFVGCLFVAGCPSKSTVEKAINATEQIDSMAQTAVMAANFAAQDNLITPVQNAQLAPKLSALQKGAKAFKTAALEFKAAYKNDTPPDVLQSLSIAFDTQIVTPFLEVLQDLKLLKNATKVIAAIGVIRFAVLSISQAFGKREVAAAINRKFDDYERSTKSDSAYS